MVSVARQLLAWYLALGAAGVAVWPLAARSLLPLPGAGAALARPLGLLAGGLLLWFGNATGLAGRGRGSAWAILGLLALAAWGAEAVTVRRRDGRRAAGGSWPERPVRDWRPFLAGELLFAVAFALWGVVRAWMPAARHTEQATDLMLLHAVASGRGFPPEDPWLAGVPLAYHDLAVWIAHWVARLAGVTPDVAFNLVQAGSFALLVHAAYGLGAALSRRDGVAPRRAIPAGLLAAGAVALAGNLAFWAVRGAAQWWWAASRVVVDTGPGLPGGRVEMIHEFPFFSYLLGDPHAHVLAMPFALLLLGLLWAAASGEGGRGLWPLLALGGGAFLLLDPWELPGLALLFLLALLVRGRIRGRSFAASSLRAFAGGATLLGAGLLLVTAARGGGTVPLRGLLPNLEHPTALLPGLLVTGQFLPGLVLLLGLAARERRLPAGALAGALLAGPVAVALGLVAAATATGVSLAAVAASWTAAVPIAPLLAALAGLAFLLLAGEGEPIGPGGRERLALLAATAGLALLVAPEVALLHDTFGHRLNTVFKLSYQAWPLLALAAVRGALGAWRAGWRAAALLALGGLFAGLPYAPLALAARLEERPPEWSLDALAHLRREAPAEAALLAWVERNVPPGTRVLQAEGESYRPESVRLSTATGRPALLGWVGHEQQWRGREWGRLAAGRADAIRRLYEEAEGEELLALLARWQVGCVLVGPEERARYRLPESREGALAAVLPEAFAAGDWRLFRMPEAGSR